LWLSTRHFASNAYGELHRLTDTVYRAKPAIMPVDANTCHTSATRLEFQGEYLTLLRSGALFCAHHKLLVVSDLHFGKGASYAAAGQMLPPYDTNATLDLVESLVIDLSPDRCISLGDSFHDPDSEAQLSSDQRLRIRRLTDQVDWVWIEGNHDPVPPVHLGGRAANTLRVGDMVFRHEPTGRRGEISGHLHPVAKVKSSGRAVRTKCFITDGNALILPSLGAFTGGLNVSHEAFNACLKEQRRIFATGTAGVYELSSSRLLRDRSRS